MRAHEILNESILTRPLVVVDVQPAYSYHINFGAELTRLIEKRTGETLMYVNAEDTGTSEDTLEEIKIFWWRFGMEEDTMAKLTWFDKGYGNLREAMDTGATDGDIIAVIREMFRQNINDSRELFDDDYDKQLEAFGEDNIEWIQNGISIMELNGFDKLKSMSPFYLCGGGKDECLKEVMLMCSALNIRYKLIDKFIY